MRFPCRKLPGAVGRRRCVVTCLQEEVLCNSFSSHLGYFSAASISVWRDHPGTIGNRQLALFIVAMGLSEMSPMPSLWGIHPTCVPASSGRLFVLPYSCVAEIPPLLVAFLPRAWCGRAPPRHPALCGPLPQRAQRSDRRRSPATPLYERRIISWPRHQRISMGGHVQQQRGKTCNVDVWLIRFACVATSRAQPLTFRGAVVFVWAVGLRECFYSDETCE